MECWAATYYDDWYRITGLGIYLSRQGEMVTWSVDEFLATAGARQPLACLRVLLRDHLRAGNRSAAAV